MRIHHHLKKHNSGWFWPLLGVLAVVLVIWWATGNQPVQDMPVVASSTQPTQHKPASSGTPVVQPTAVQGTDVVSVAQSLGSGGTFSSWLSSTGVASLIQGKGPYTLFVPSDAALAQLTKGTFTGLSAAEQKRFVEYYVISGRVISTNVPLEGSVEALSRDKLNFTRTDTSERVNNASIVGTFKASNGVVYLINAALIPPKKAF